MKKPLPETFDEVLLAIAARLGVADIDDFPPNPKLTEGYKSDLISLIGLKYIEEQPEFQPPRRGRGRPPGRPNKRLGPPNSKDTLRKRERRLKKTLDKIYAGLVD